MFAVSTNFKNVCDALRGRLVNGKVPRKFYGAQSYVVVRIRRGNKVLFVRQRASSLFGPPKGCIEMDTNAEGCVLDYNSMPVLATMRELKEELNLKVSPNDVNIVSEEVIGQIKIDGMIFKKIVFIIDVDITNNESYIRPDKKEITEYIFTKRDDIFKIGKVNWAFRYL